ncbi:MAG TPA: SBBP repeat-containing protein [Kofleriaceae bacterium]|nr:SBBP repeat-containing protein [Kofleriaceae bacterium]
MTLLRVAVCALVLAPACKGGSKEKATGKEPTVDPGPSPSTSTSTSTSPQAPVKPATPSPPLPADPGGKGKLQHGWSTHLGGTDAESGRHIAVDARGNVYVTGIFRDKVDFGDGTVLTADGPDGFVAAIGPDGKTRWARRMGGKGDDIADTIAVDPQGNVVVGGSFSYELEIGDGKMTSKGADDLFVVKLDPAGKRLWGKRLGGGDVDAAEGVAIDAKGNIAVIGSYSQEIEVGSEKLIGEGDTDILLTMLDPDGKVLWARSWSSMGPDEGRAVGFDKDGNLYALAEFSREVDFGGGPLKSGGNRDLVIVKLDPTGAHVWSRRFGAQLDELATGMAVDPVGSVVVTGAFDDVLDLGDGAPMKTAGRSDVFVFKLGPDGSTQWGKRLGDKDEDIGAAVAVDDWGNVYVGGWYWRQLELGTEVVKSAGKKDMFLLALTAGGDPLWLKSFGQGEDDYARGLATSGRALYATGTYHVGVDLGGGVLAATADPKGKLPLGDVFVAKFQR